MPNVGSFFVGTPVRTSDGTEVGHVEGFALEPDTRRVTHLIVQTGRSEWTSRLVPIESAHRDREVVNLALDAAEYGKATPIDSANPLDPSDSRHHALRDLTPTGEVEIDSNSTVTGAGDEKLGHLIEIEFDEHDTVTRIGVKRGRHGHHYAFAPAPVISEFRDDQVVLRWSRDEERAEEDRISDRP
jgi:sporulation protein YlmC with PRC-barrel domain